MRAPATGSDRKVLRATFVAFIALGMPKAAVAVAWPSMADALDRQIADLGILIAVYIAGFLVAAVLSGHATARLGTGAVLLGASAGSTAALIGYSAAPSWTLLLAAALLLGFCGGLIDPGVNAYVAVHHDVRAMGWLHAGFGIGAALGPLLITALLGLNVSWRIGFWTLTAAQLAVTAALVSVNPLWRASPQPPAGRGTSIFRQPVVLAVFAVFLIYTGIEVGAGQWVFTLFTEQREISEAAAGIAVTAFWLALTASRILLGVVGDRISPVTAALASSLLAIAAFSIIWWSPSAMSDLAALVLAGAALGPVFPLHMQLTPLRVGADTAAVMVGYQMVAAGSGAILIPGGIGLAAGEIGLTVIAPLLVLSAVALLLAGEVVRRLTPRD